MPKTLGKLDDRVLWIDKTERIKKRRKISPRLIPLALVLAILVTTSLFYVWTRIRVVQIGYEISNALKEQHLLKETNKKLRIEIASLKSYERIERIAEKELGMQRPKADQVVVMIK